MHEINSKDGTPIAFEKSGEGPAVILVTGATALGSSMRPLAARLAPYFTAFNYDRRGRGESGDTQPYAVEREIEDIEVLLDEAGGSAFLYGISSGGALALEAANRLPAKVSKLALYEPPFIVDGSHTIPEDYVPHLRELISAGRRGDAVEYFMAEAVGVPAEFISQMRNEPMWPQLEAVANTIVYDGMIMGDHMSGKPLPPTAWTSATMPTLVMNGGASPAFFEHGAKALVDILPNAQHRILAGQNHGVEEEALAPALVEFFSN